MKTATDRIRRVTETLKQQTAMLDYETSRLRTTLAHEGSRQNPSRAHMSWEALASAATCSTSASRCAMTR